MKRSILTSLLVITAASWAAADDFTADNLTINASATISGAATFNSGAQINGGISINGPSYITGTSVVWGAASFGTVLTGLQSANTTSNAFTISVAQGFQDVQLPYTVAGHYEDGYVTVEDYGTVTSGYWEAQYSDVIGGYNYVMPVYDTEGNIITAGYDEPWYTSQFTGYAWIDTSHWGVTGTHSEPGQVWVAPYESTYTDYQAGIPKIQLTATRSDANWAWQVPTASGVKDILLLWDGGLRLPSADTNRMMALLSDSLTQSYLQPWDGNQERLDSSELRMDELKTFTQVRHDIGGGEVTEKSTSQLRSESIQFSREEQQNGTSSTVQTQIAAKSASFGGVVQVAGDMKVLGVLRVLPAGDLDMGAYTAGVQP